MHMIGLDRDLFQVPAVDRTRLTQQCFQADRDLALKDALAILGDEDEMVAQFVGRVRSGPVAFLL